MALKLLSIYGVPIYVDYSFLIIFVVIVWSVGFVLMPASFPGLSQPQYLTIGLISAILLFFSILVHELAHSIVAKRNGLRIGRITLFLFGGVSEIEGQPTTPGMELRMAAAGPVTSIAIALICGGLWLVSLSIHETALIQAPLQYSLLVNAIVAGFNLIPAFPMDGGRILRATLWRSNHDFVRSTKISATIGRVFAYIMIFAGILSSFFYDFFAGLWLVLIGWFVYSGAGGELNQTLLQRDLDGLRASNLMYRSFDTVTPEISLNEISERFGMKKLDGLPVVRSPDELIGFVSMRELSRAKKEERTTKSVSDVMIPRRDLPIAREDESALSVIRMFNSRTGTIFVVNDSGKLSGLITRADISRTVQSEESKFANSPTYDYARTISVEQGMLFELDSPIESGVDWMAVFNSSEFFLVNQRMLQLSEGGQVKQFTFEPLNKGRFIIPLKKKSLQPASKVGEAQVSYTIIVR